MFTIIIIIIIYLFFSLKNMTKILITKMIFAVCRTH